MLIAENGSCVKKTEKGVDFRKIRALSAIFCVIMSYG